MKHNNLFKQFSLSIIWVWLLIFALLPFGLVTIASFMNHSESHLIESPLTWINYLQLNNSIYLRIFKESFYVATFCSLICLLLGYPFAYLIARTQSRFKGLLILLIIIPFWTSSLIRCYSMITILKPKGVINSILMWSGIIDKPLSLLFTDTAVMIGLVYNLLPFMVLPLLTNIERLDGRLIDAARDLGANRVTTFRKIILPLTLPGILSGCILVFLPAMTIFYIPDLLGGSKSILLGNLIQNQFLIAQNWPLGSAISIVLTLLLAVLLLIYWHSMRRNAQVRDLL
ncbi:MAG: Putrescine transport system permease protein PotH [uncultured bacterium]|nr:MAG: Putrescine transport system permease protein PotH [uncultured bacterium]